MHPILGISHARSQAKQTSRRRSTTRVGPESQEETPNPRNQTRKEARQIHPGHRKNHGTQAGPRTAKSPNQEPGNTASAEAKIPGSEETCRRRIYEKEAAELGKMTLSLPGKSERKNNDLEKQTQQEPGRTTSTKRPKKKKKVREQARTEDTDSGNHQRTVHAQGPVSRSRARFPGEGRMRCAAQS